MAKATEMESIVLNKRNNDSEVACNASCAAQSSRIILPETHNLECRIDPLAFPMDAPWMMHEPTSCEQSWLKQQFLEARAKGRLHSFTCMKVAPSYDEKNDRLVYKSKREGKFPEVDNYKLWWEIKLKQYDPSRSSRMMSKTEGVCERLFLIGKLVEEKRWAVKKAWHAICDDSVEIKEVYGFHDLIQTSKILTTDPWEEKGYYVTGAIVDGLYSIVAMLHCSYGDIPRDAFAELAID